jgi:hypothetical protein
MCSVLYHAACAFAARVRIRGTQLYTIFWTKNDSYGQKIQRTQTVAYIYDFERRYALACAHEPQL